MSHQSGIEAHLRAKAVKRVPTLEKALAEREKDIAEDPDNPLAANWQILIDSYRKDLKTIAEGSYPGYNGLPFGGGPGIN